MLSDNRYKHGEIECIDAIKAALNADEFRGFCKGNILKYIWREEYKGGYDDIEKANTYVKYLLETYNWVPSDITEEQNEYVEKLDKLIGIVCQLENIMSELESDDEE